MKAFLWSSSYRKNEILKLLLMAALSVLMSACVVVPVGLVNSSPYAPEVLEKLPKGSSKAAVQKVFGPPKSTNDGGRYWFYANRRDMVGVIGSPSAVVWDKFEWLLVEFDDAGRLVFIEANEVGKCASNSICLDGAAKPSEDQKARGYVLKNNECGVYLYLEALPWYLTTGVVKYRVDGKPVGTVNKETFLFVPHVAGVVRIAAYDLKLSADCQAGSNIYVRAVKKKDMSWETGESLSLVDISEGEKAIQERRLAMPD